MGTNTKEYARQHYLKNKEKYKQSAKEWIKNNPEKFKNITTKWRKNNPQKWLEIQRICSKRNYEVHKAEQLVRVKTYKKYGKLPKGFEYHHTTRPYHVDKFVIIITKEHHKIHNEVI